MTRWDRETVSPAFQKIGEEAIRIAEACPLATRTDNDGNPDKESLFIREIIPYSLNLVSYLCIKSCTVVIELILIFEDISS